MRSCGDECHGQPRAFAGQRMFAGFGGLDANGRAIRLRSARVVNVPDGMKIVGIRAMSRAENDGTFFISRRNHPPGPQHGIHGTRVEPGNEDGVYLMVEFTVTKPGTHIARGIKVDYEAGWKKGSRTFEGFEFGAELTAEDVKAARSRTP
jgi:hypothetical protein